MLHIVARDAAGGVDFGGPVADAPDFSAKSGSPLVPTAPEPGVITAADRGVDHGSGPGSNAVGQTLEVDGKSTIACLVCRSRKVRCDKTLPACRNCVRLGVNCPGYNLETEAISRTEIQRSAEDIFRAAGVEKRKVGSCEECRASKHRCTRTRPSCRRCIVKRLRCVYPDRVQRQSAPSSTVPAVTAALVSLDAGTSQCPSPQQSQSQSWPSSQGYAQQQLPVRLLPETCDPVNNPPPDSTAEFSAENEQLFTDTLPSDIRLRLQLVNAFFGRSYSLRCLGFLHKPSFLQALECESVVQDFGEPLLYVLCALGARHLYLDEKTSKPGFTDWRAVPGQEWAERARRDVLAEIHAPTVQHLMAMVLLCDYGLRSDQNPMVFVLVAFLYRVIRLLGLDSPPPLENPGDPAQVLERDVQNRLVWACYFIDLFMATGVEKNACWKGSAPDILLPAPDEFFFVRSPAIQYALPDVDGILDANLIRNLDLPAVSIIVIRLRVQGLRLIRKEPQHLETELWNPTSPFMRIIGHLDTIYQCLNVKLHLSDANIPMLKADGRLGGVFFLHFLLHAVVFDLTRVSLPGFTFPLASAFQHAPPDFRSDIQTRCWHHALLASELVRKGLHFGREAFDDIFTTDAALEAAKIQIIYASTVSLAPDVIMKTRDCLSSTLHFFATVDRGKSGQNQYIQTLLPLCFIFGFGDMAEPYQYYNSAENDAAEVTGSAEVDHLSRFAPFRRAQAELKGTRSTNSPRTVSSQNTHGSLGTQESRQRSTALAGTPAEYDTRKFAGVAGSAAPITQEQYVASTNQFAGSMNGIMTSGTAMPPGVDDYLRRASEMSGYLTWEQMNLPQWFHNGNVYPP